MRVTHKGWRKKINWIPLIPAYAGDTMSNRETFRDDPFNPRVCG